MSIAELEVELENVNKQLEVKPSLDLVLLKVEILESIVYRALIVKEAT